MINITTQGGTMTQLTIRQEDTIKKIRYQVKELSFLIEKLRTENANERWVQIAQDNFDIAGMAAVRAVHESYE